MKKTKRLKTGRRIAKVAFDAEAHMAKRVRLAETLARFFNYCSKVWDLGVVEVVDQRGRSYFREEWPGALKAAEQTEGPCGRILRLERSQGHHSKSESVRAMLEYRRLSSLNSEIRALLDKDRNNAAARQQVAVLKTGIDRWVAMLKSVEAGNEWIYQNIKNDPDCRDIAPNWPLRLQNGLPIPIVDPHKTGVEAYQAPKRTRKPKEG